MQVTTIFGSEAHKSASQRKDLSLETKKTTCKTQQSAAEEAP